MENQLDRECYHLVNWPPAQVGFSFPKLEIKSLGSFLIIGKDECALSLEPISYGTDVYRQKHALSKCESSKWKIMYILVSFLLLWQHTLVKCSLGDETVCFSWHPRVTIYHWMTSRQEHEGRNVFYYTLHYLLLRSSVPRQREPRFWYGIRVPLMNT